MPPPTPRTAPPSAASGGPNPCFPAACPRLLAVSESYPDLKANQTMAELMEALSSTENRIGFARQAFNDAVMHYNTYREQFPNNLVSGLFGPFRAAELLEIDDPQARQAVNVTF